RAVDGRGTPDAALADALRELTAAQLAPTPPIADGRAAALAGATAMIDLSDGLAIDADRVARASGVAIDFDRSALGGDPERALRGGEDHSLLATFPPTVALPGNFRRVGIVIETVPDNGSAILLDGVPHPVTGWDPYADHGTSQSGRATR
ncbi:MAG: thiamine-phosphate kinase, partial [Cryobacterium sp.]|nr:thiamine-phosphate kinase [Cryobacterium sp.]